MIGWQVNDDEWTNICALRAIRTHGLSLQVIKAYASDLAATGSGDYDGQTCSSYTENKKYIQNSGLEVS
jgi:hypothetical protein